MSRSVTLRQISIKTQTIGYGQRQKRGNPRKEYCSLPRIELDEASLKVPSCPLHLCAQNNVSQHLLTFAVAATDMIICTLPQKQSVIFGTANKSIVEL